uniref:Integrin alpha FG-GAP repeat containing 1 n=1 Tax=Astyanax mexicanus TaxID=7994 RepID=A0A8B9HQP7_ASTMX
MWPPCFSSVLALVLLFSGYEIAFGLQDVTTDLFGTENKGTVAAFGDFNSDKQTDIFIIREQSELLIFLADLKAPYFKPKVHLTKNAFPSIISSVVPGDYDGDSQMDVLITGHPKSSDGQQTKIIVFWGNNQTLGKALINTHWPHYYNGDMIPDIFGGVDGVTEVCFLKPSCKTALSTEVKFRVPHSNAFIDLNKDFTAALKKKSAAFPSASFHCFLLFLILLNVFLPQNGNFTQSTLPSTAPNKTEKVGQSAFVDFDGDGSQDHLLPVCLDKDCTKSAIYLAKPSQDKQQAFLLENVPCTNASCRELGRMFRVHWEQSDLSAIHSAAVATFFDIYEDGILDMMVLSQSADKKELTIHALKNNFEADAYFVKVIVLSGLCSNDCPNKVKPFGVNQPGPYVMYTSVDSNGYLKNASAGQLSQSAHLSLQLPYTVLGLGRSANFLDHLFVGIPRPPEVKDTRKQEWTAIIPNSQLIVIPYPNSQPHSWSAKLYLTPSNIVLLTAIALIGVCVFILVIIGVLHWQEKKADDREKRQEAHRFHFDAM